MPRKKTQPEDLDELARRGEAKRQREAEDGGFEDEPVKLEDAFDPIDEGGGDEDY